MLKYFFITLIFVVSLFGNKVIYLSYDKVPNRVIKGEVFPITLKALSTVRDFDDIHYEFSNHPGIEILDEEPQRLEKGKFYYDTFHLRVDASYAKLPDVTASLIALRDYNTTSISGKKLNVVALNPKKDFCHVIANSFTILEYKTTSYDTKHNIVIFIANASNTQLESLFFNNVYKQGIESQSGDYNNSKITYFVVINKNIENFKFSYFNLPKNEFQTLSIPIVVDDDSVTTQSDLKPRDQSHDMIKVYISAVIVLFGIILLLWRKRLIYLLLVFIPLAYIIYLLMPEEKICIKEGANIYLLPVQNGTIFEQTHSRIELPKEGDVKNFIKVKLNNNKIGWVKNEDTCSY